MNRQSLDDFVRFGSSLIYVRLSVGANAPYKGDGFTKENIEIVLDFIKELNLRVSISGSRKLKSLKSEFDEKYDDGQSLEGADKDKLVECMRILEAMIFAEVEQLTAFFSREQRYNTDFLFEDMAKIFGEDTFGKLPNNAREDFSEAGKCIVFERPTATAYHLMRGAECVLKHLYKCVVKKGRKKTLTWGSMVPHLEERKAMDDALRGTLDNFRRGFRNPVSHPDKFFSSDEAQDLLGTTTQLVALLVAHEKYEKPTE